MPKIRLRINEPWEHMDARVLENIRRYEAGELTEDFESDFGFQSWEHFASVLKAEAPRAGRRAAHDAGAGPLSCFRHPRRTRSPVTAVGPDGDRHKLSRLIARASTSP